jgi:dihydroorotate dehydrogenase electron transfer subunit
MQVAVRKNYRARLLESREVIPNHFRWRLECPEIAQGAIPGQFIHVLPSEAPFSQSFDPLLRRAFSIMTTDKQNSFEIVFRAMGKGTGVLARRDVGEFVDLLGPLGIPFDLSLFHVKQKSKAILVGGGIGVPPMVFLGDALKAQGFEFQPIIGARSGNDVIGIEEFEELNITPLVATEDGTLGQQGRVTDILRPLLENDAANVVVYTCGPLPMLKAVAKSCEEFEVPCQVSMEENMPCGIGVCNGCVIKTKPNFRQHDQHGEVSDYEVYRRACVEGPVCNANEVDWE